MNTSGHRMSVGLVVGMNRPGFRRNLSVALLVAVALALGPVSASAQESRIPPAPPGKAVLVDRAFADSVAREVFGLSWTDVTESDDRFSYVVSGYLDSRMCPFDGIRDLSCGEFTWEPSRLTVYRDAWDGPLSGHLSINRVVAVDMASESAPFATGSMHGVLVLPTVSVDRGKKPAFGWYLSRSGVSVSMSFRDISGDGLPDVVYNYRQMMPGGVEVVPRDVWSFAGMTAARYLSSGEKITGVSSSRFEGVPVVLQSDERHEFGRFMFNQFPVSQAPDMTVVGQSLMIERAVFGTGDCPSWEIQLMADLGEGWLDYLSVVGSPCSPPESTGSSGPGIDAAPLDRCSMNDLPPDAQYGVRRGFLGVEAVCRFVDEPVAPMPPVFRAVAMVWRGLILAVAGYPMLGSVFLESAAIELDATGSSGFLFSVMAGAAASTAISGTCQGPSRQQCWNEPAEGYRGFLADWMFDIPGVIPVAMKALSAWLAEVGLID